MTGKDDGYNMYLNGVQATCTSTTTPTGATYSVTKSFTAKVNIGGHLNFYVHDSGNYPVVNKEYPVKMTGVNMNQKFKKGEQVTAAADLQAGEM